MSILFMTRPQRAPLSRFDLCRQRQSGVVLVIALIVLVAMTLAGLAMVRSVDTSTKIAGNIAFKENAAWYADAGVESAITWLSANSNSLNADNASAGYYATSQDGLDLTGNATASTADDLDWTDSTKVKILSQDAVTGNTVAYVIHRMCDSAGALNGATCSTAQTSQTGGSQGGNRQMQTYQMGSWTSVANQGYYRITVRVQGPAKNYSFIQTFVAQ